MRSLSLYSTLELGRVAPEGWGVSMPVTFTHTDLSQDPTFLAQSDVRVDRGEEPQGNGNEGNPGRSGAPEDHAHRESDPGSGPGWSESSGRDIPGHRSPPPPWSRKGLGWMPGPSTSRRSTAREVGLVPGFAEGVVRALFPKAWEESLLGARLRWTPERVRMGTLFTRRDREAYRFEQILVRPCR